jgi:P4 family phage/plasmid primase-like protien
MNVHINPEKARLQSGVEPYILAGLVPVPLHKWDAPDGKGKAPRDSKWTTTAYDSTAVLAEAIKRGINVGVRPGLRFLIIDVDVRNGGHESFVAFCKAHGLIADKLPMVLTGGGGFHYFVRLPKGAPKLRKKLREFPGIDFLSGDGVQAVCAGSRHPSGNFYEWDWMDEGRPALKDAPILADDIVAVLARPTVEDMESDAPEVEAVSPEVVAEVLDHVDVLDFHKQEQEWRDFMMATVAVSDGEAVDEWVAWSTGDPEYADDGDKIRERWKSIAANKPGGITAKSFYWIAREHGAPQSVLAKLLPQRPAASAHEAFGDDGEDFKDEDEAPADDPNEFETPRVWPHPCVYDPQGNTRANARVFLDARPRRVIACDGKYYSMDDATKLWRMIAEKQLAVEVVQTDKTPRLGHGKVEGLVKAIAYETDTLGVRPFHWLKPPKNAPEPSNLIVFRNGILDTATGKLIPHTGDYFATGAPDFDYDPHATCPLWLKCLKEWLDPSYHATLQEFMGYLLTPDIFYEVMLLLLGAKGGGKGTILHVIRGLIGDAHHATRTLNDFGTDFALDGLQDKRVCIFPDAHDVSPGKRPAVLERIKSITGRDPVSINGKNKDIVEMMLLVKLLLVANKPPKFLDESGALAARQIVITFENSWRGGKNAAKADPHLRTKLDAELPGIANWALRGLKRLRAHGRFTIGKEGKAAAVQLAEGQSVVQRFAADELQVTGKPDDFERLEDVFQRYREWAEGVEHVKDQERRDKTGFRTDLESAYRSEGVRYYDQKWVSDPTTPKGGRNVCALFGVKLKPKSPAVAYMRHALADDGDDDAEDPAEFG